MSNVASLDETRQAIEGALVQAGGVYATYGCKTVSWDDVSRGEAAGSLSCWGANITDTYLKGKDGSSLFTVRSNNWNEKLGVVCARDVALLIGNCDQEDGARDQGLLKKHGLRNVTLEDFLREPSKHGASYAGVEPNVCFLDEVADEKVSIRFQTVFLPVRDDGEDINGTFQFATEAFNYNTNDDEHPRNLVLLATTQGLSVQQDGEGSKRLLLHARDGDHVNEYWLEAESSRHKVGTQQIETASERDDALRRGKATSERIGILAMGRRFNVLMTIQIPLLQSEEMKTDDLLGSLGYALACADVSGDSGESSEESSEEEYEFGLEDDCDASEASNVGEFDRGGSVSDSFALPPEQATVRKTLCALGEEVQGDGYDSDDEQEVQDELHQSEDVAACDSKTVCEESLLDVGNCGNTPRIPSPSLKRGRARAARVSRGDCHGRNEGLSLTRPERNRSEHVTVTCVFYATVAGGVPAFEDVVAAVTDMEAMYTACSESGRLTNEGFGFMKAELA